MPNWRHGSECLKLEEIALNACTEDGNTECQVGQWLWMPKWRHEFEHQTEEDDGSKCQTEDMALNA